MQTTGAGDWLTISREAGFGIYAPAASPDHPGGAPSDEVLLVQVRDGGTAAAGAALAELYARHAGSAVAAANRLLDHQEAEDVVQEVFLSLERRAERFDPSRGCARSWLLAVVRNRALDHLRRQRLSHDELDAVPEAYLRDVRTPSAFDELYERTRRELVWQAVARLPMEQRTLVLRSYYEGQTHQEIAQQSGLPLGTVKSRIRLALEKLARTLGDYAGDVTAPARGSRPRAILSARAAA